MQIQFARPSVGIFLLAVFMIITGLAFFGVGPLPAILMGLLALATGLCLLLGI